jgi:hypothetical protein
MDLGGYVLVQDRLKMALERFPNLRVQETDVRPVEIAGQTFIAVTMTVYREPGDDLPSVATAYEVFPGRTPFQKGSEMMNASTSALGRALGFMGFGISRSIASADEVSLRVNERENAPKARQDRPRTTSPTETTQSPPTDGDGPPPTAKQLEFLIKLATERGVESPEVNTMADASAAIKTLTALPKKQATDEAPF